MQSFPRVTVVLPSLNVAPYIRKCLDSVLGQSLPDIEVIVVDAASTDGTHEILKEYAQNDHRVRLLDDTKKSTGYAKNLGIDQARAPYIAIVEPDDYIAPDMMETLYNKAEETGADIVKADFSSFIEKDGEELLFPKSVSALSSDYNKVQCPRDELHCFSWAKNEWLGIYRTSFLNKYNVRHNESKGAAFQDIGFWFLSFTYADRVCLIRKNLYRYRKDNPYASMMNRGKVYDTLHEYEYISSQLEQDPNAYTSVKTAYYHALFVDNCSVYKRIRRDDRIALINILREKMLKARDDGSLSKSRFTEGEWQDLICLLESTKLFAQKWKDEESERKQHLDKLLQEMDGKEIIVFGAGSYGSNLKYLLETHNMKICAFGDNAEEKWNKTLNGTMILSLKQCRQRYPEALYLIAHKNQGEEIKDSMIKSGILVDHIIVCALEELTDVLL